MYFSDVSLNLVSMGGLALAIGMLVDNAVVVIENIYRLINEGKSKKEAAIEGAKEVAGAITASTLTTIAVFLPIVFVEGMISDVFISMALTIAYSLGASLIIALSLVPAMSAKLLDDKKVQKEGKVIHTMKNWYEKSIKYTLKHRILTLVVILVLLVGSAFVVIRKGFILLPGSDEGTININIETKSTTPFLAKSELADYVTLEIMDMDAVETVSGTIGGSGFAGMMMGGFGGMMSGGESISITVNLKDSRNISTDEATAEILKIVEDVDYDSLPDISEADILDYSVSAQNSTLSLAGTSGIRIKVSGYDLLTLESIGNDLVNILQGIEHVEEADNGVNQAQDQVKLTVNNNIAMEHGLTNQDVLDSLNYLYSNLGGLEGTDSITVQIEGVDYEVEVPSESFQNISFEMFGDYLTFLSGVRLFDQEAQAMIEEYLDTNDVSLMQGNTIYTFNALLPTYQAGDPIVFILNPFLKINSSNKIVFNPADTVSPTLASISEAPLFNLADETASVTTIEKVTGFALINTDGTQRYINVTAQVEDGYNVTLVSQNVTDAVEDYIENDLKEYGSGYLITLEGENEEILDAVSDLTLAALVAILLVYMIIAIQFQSLLYPLIILVTVPLAFTGGFLALWITGMNISMVSLMGLIILVGVVVNNGIVLIDYINKLRERGKTVEEAIIEAGKTRLRPIFMTALTTILALVVTALGIGEGAELLQPMAVTAIGGLIYATILTLVVAPTIYAMFNRKKMREEALKDATDED
jgi:multidrug efflux pump subunit AcrB